MNTVTIDGVELPCSTASLALAIYDGVQSVVRAGAHETLRVPVSDDVTRLISISPTTTVSALLNDTRLPEDARLGANLDAIREMYRGYSITP